MTQFVRKISIWNEKNEHYEFTNDFDEAVGLCELIYDFRETDLDWLEVKSKRDFYILEQYLYEKGIEVVTDINEEMKYGS